MVLNLPRLVVLIQNWINNANDEYYAREFKEAASNIGVK